MIISYFKELDLLENFAVAKTYKRILNWILRKFKKIKGVKFRPKKKTSNYNCFCNHRIRNKIFMKKN